MTEQRFEEKEREIRDMLKDFQTSNITIENYGRWFENVKNRKEIILTNIGSIEDAKNQLVADAKEQQNTTAFKANYEMKLVSLEYYNIRRDINRLTNTAYSWMALLNEMYLIIVEKAFALFDDVKAHTVRKESLELMREDAKRISDMTVEITSQVTDMQQKNIENQINMMEQRFVTTINSVLQNFGTVVSKLNTVEVSDVSDAVDNVRVTVEKKVAPVAPIKPVSPVVEKGEDEPLTYLQKRKLKDKEGDDSFEKGFDKFD